MGVTGHVPQPAPEARALSRQEQAARYAPYQALIEKIEELDAYSHQVMHQWPKIERFVLAAEIRATLLRIRRICAVAWKRRQKAAALFDLDVEIEILRHLRADYATGRASLRDARQMIMSCIAYYRHASAQQTLACALSETLLTRSLSC